MNIAIIHDWLTNMAGAEKVLRQLKDIYPEADIYTSVYDEEKVGAFKDCEVQTTYLQKYFVFRKHREALIPFAPLAFESLDLSKYDLVISNTTFPAKGVITKPDTLHICYCHTPTRYLWEPELDSRAKQGFFTKLRQNTAHKLRIWDRVACERPDYYFGNSETVVARIKKYYGRDADVIYPPVDTAKFSPDKNNKSGDYYLFVSRLIDYKRADIVIKAFNELGLPLKIIGSGPEEKKLKKMAANNIDFLGRINDKELAESYQGAKAFVFAAEEDFGIVPVEAMACGKPVITFGKGGAAESVIDRVTGVHFPEQSPESIMEAVVKFQTMEFDTEKILRRSREFSNDLFKAKFSTLVNKYVKIHLDRNKS